MQATALIPSISLLLISLAAGQAAPAPEERPAPLSQIKSVLYGDDLMRSFLTQYLELTSVQSAKIDISLAETRLKLIESTEELHAANAGLDRAISFGEDQKQVDDILLKQAATIRRLLDQEVAGLRGFLAILDGEQRYRLSLLQNVRVTQVNGQPTIAFEVAPGAGAGAPNAPMPVSGVL